MVGSKSYTMSGEPSWERRHLSPIFDERWPLAYLCFQATVLALWVVVKEDLVWREANLWRSAIYHQFLVKVASSSLCVSEGFVSGSVARWLAFLAVSPGFGH